MKTVRIHKTKLFSKTLDIFGRVEKECVSAGLHILQQSGVDIDDASVSLMYIDVLQKTFTLSVVTNEHEYKYTFDFQTNSSGETVSLLLQAAVFPRQKIEHDFFLKKIEFIV